MLAIVIEGLMSALVLPSIELHLALRAAGQFQLGSGAALAQPGNGGCWEIGWGPRCNNTATGLHLPRGASRQGQASPREDVLPI